MEGSHGDDLLEGMVRYNPWARQSGWERKAACRGEDPNLFYPEGTQEFVAEMTARARRICDGCPVSLRCRIYIDAIEATKGYAYWYGVWAGEDPSERRERRRRSNPAWRDPNRHAVLRRVFREFLEFSDPAGPADSGEPESYPES